jgi:hypothetical protein
MSEIIDISVGLTEERVEISTTEVSNLEINAIPTVVEVNIISRSTINPGFYDLSDFTNNSSDPFVRYSALDAKQDRITLTTAGSNGPATFIGNVLNVPDYSSAPRGLYAQTARSIPITNTTVETSLLDGGVGTLSVPANAFKVGDSFCAVLTGHISSLNNHTLHIRIKSDGVALADTGIITMPATTGKHWKLDIIFTIRAIGPAGTASIASGGSFLYNKNASNALEGVNFSTETSTVFDTTIANTLVITAQWGTANAGDSIYSELFTLTKTY